MSDAINHGHSPGQSRAVLDSIRGRPVGVLAELTPDFSGA